MTGSRSRIPTLSCLLGILLLGACTSTKTSDITVGEDFDGGKRAEIRARETTRADVEAALGQPYRKYRENGREYYEYYYERTKHETEKVLYLIPGKAEENHVFKRLVIEFDGDTVSSIPQYTHNFERNE